MATFTYDFAGTAGTKLATVSGWSKLGSGWDPEGPELNGSGQLRAPNPASDVAMIGRAQTSTDHYAQAKVYAGFAYNGTGSRSLICVRTSSRGEYWGGGYNSAEGVWEIFSTFGRSGTYSATLVDGDVCRVEAEGNTVRLKVNGVTRITESGASAYNTYLNVGVLVRDRPAADPVMDDWESGELAAGDTTAPTLTSVSGTDTGSTSATVSASSTEAGPGWAVLTPTSTQPSQAQVEAGQDHTGSTSGVFLDTATLAIGANPAAFAFTGLTPGATYWPHVVAKDTATPTANVSAVESGASFTMPVPDTTAPVLSAPVGTVRSNSLIVIGATTDEANGTMFAVLTTSATPPSAAQVMAGQDHMGTAAPWDGNQAISSTGAKTFNALGPAPLTGYYPYIMHRDSASTPNNSLVMSVGLRTTFRNGATAQYVIDNTAAVGGNPAGHMYALALTKSPDDWMSYRTISGPTPSGGTLTEQVDGRFTYTGLSSATWVTQAEINGVDHTETTIITLYDMTARVAAYFGLAWSVRNYVSTTKTLSWSVRNLLATTKTLAFSVRNLVATTKTLDWSIRSLVSTTKSLAWSLRNLVETSFTLAWSVDGGAAPEVSTLIVEDGTAKADADSYISVADADAYFSKRGITLWASLLMTEKEQALRRATDYMGEVYRTSWAGYRKTDTQALDWPRYEVPRIDSQRSFGYGRGYSIAYYDESTVPAEVKRACAELAFRAASGELSPDIGQRVKREKVDVLEVEYADGASPYTRYRAVDNMLRPFLGGRPNQIKLVRG